MAINAINTALSGLFASSRSLEVSAQNIANVQSTTSSVTGPGVNTPYVPQQVAQQSNVTGGVSTSLYDVSPASVPVFDPQNPLAASNGTVDYPNVNLEQEVANQTLAANTYRANAAVIRRENETFQSLLDITS